MNEIKPKVSVIIPIYKVEKYLERCIDSAVNQTLHEIEIILINDGSPDKCPEICDSYKKKDNRIIVIHQKNYGVAYARNEGLKKATGEYIYFIDSDDYILEDALYKLYTAVKKDDLDILATDVMKNTKGISYDKIITGEQFLLEQLKNKSLKILVFLNVYKRSFIINNNLYFKNLTVHEDEQWIPRVFLKAKRVKCVKTEHYRYTVRADSFTNSPYKTKNGLDLLSICYELESQFSNIENAKLRKYMNDYLAMLYLYAASYLYSSEHAKIINKKFLYGKPVFIKNKFKVYLFIFSIKLYNKLKNILRN